MDITQDGRCKICKLRSTTVPGEGPSTASVIFIGEAPGAEEDRLGRPFIGRSGQLLRRIMSRCGIDPSSIFITNIVKCHPPENRTPTASEIRACKPIVLKEIENIDPSLVVFVGSTSMRGLTGKKPIMEVDSGRIFEWNGRSCIVIYHPAWVLRDIKSRTPVLERQMKEIATRIKVKPGGLERWA